MFGRAYTYTSTYITNVQTFRSFLSFSVWYELLTHKINHIPNKSKRKQFDELAIVRRGRCHTKRTHRKEMTCSFSFWANTAIDIAADVVASFCWAMHANCCAHVRVFALPIQQHFFCFRWKCTHRFAQSVFNLWNSICFCVFCHFRSFGLGKHKIIIFCFRSHEWPMHCWHSTILW